MINMYINLYIYSKSQKTCISMEIEISYFIFGKLVDSVCSFEFN